MKIVINRCWGGFGLSHKAIMRYAELAGITLYPFVDKNMDFSNPTYEPYKEGTEPFIIHYATKPLNENGKYEDKSYWSANFKRDDPLLIKVIEEMGEGANGTYAELKIVDIPDGTKYEIDEYDGMETIEELHNSWY